jgi:hypothetical protein
MKEAAADLPPFSSPQSIRRYFQRFGATIEFQRGFFLVSVWAFFGAWLTTQSV